jgi:hypothetical protein
VWTPKGFDWVYRRFIADRVDGYEVIIARPMENRHLLGAVPDFYERLRSSYDDAFFRQEVLGEYVDQRAGRVYADFEHGLHVKECRIDVRYPLLWALDFNVNPMCSVVAQIVNDEIRVLDEIVLNRAKTTDACEVFYQRYKDHTTGLTIYGDASGASQKTTGDSDYGIIREYLRRTRFSGARLQVPSKNPSVRDRVTMVNTKLKNAIGEVKLFVDPKCKELIRDLAEVCYKAESTEIDKDRDPRRTHLSDALGYLIYQECRPQARVGERSQPLF